MGQENFDWIVNAVAEMAVKMAVTGEDPAREMRWAAFLAGRLPRESCTKGEPGGWRKEAGQDGEVGAALLRLLY